MAFDSIGNCAPMSAKQGVECKPDYEKQAAAMKKKLEATKGLERAIYDFRAVNDLHRFSQISSMAELLGGVMIVKDEQTRGYDELLAIIEKG